MKTTTEAERPDGRLQNPAHPGELFRRNTMDPLGLTVTKTASILGVSRKTVSEWTNGKTSLTPDMALRVSIAFNGQPDFWLKMQAAYDAWQIEKLRPELQKVVTVVKWENEASA